MQIPSLWNILNFALRLCQYFVLILTHGSLCSSGVFPDQGIRFVCGHSQNIWKHKDTANNRNLLLFKHTCVTERSVQGNEVKANNTTYMYVMNYYANIQILTTMLAFCFFTNSERANAKRHPSGIKKYMVISQQTLLVWVSEWVSESIILAPCRIHAMSKGTVGHLGYYTNGQCMFPTRYTLRKKKQLNIDQ